MLFTTPSILLYSCSVLGLPWALASPLESELVQNALARHQLRSLTARQNSSIINGTGYANGSSYSNSSSETPPYINGIPQDNCGGSHWCSWKPIFSGGVVHTDCVSAYEQFSDFKVYGRYTIYSTGHCAATLNCEPTQEYTGRSIRRYFDHIYQKQPCKKCGEHYFNQTGFPKNSCMVKLDYCSGHDCDTKGDPPDEWPPLSNPTPEQLKNFTTLLAAENLTLVDGKVTDMTGPANGTNLVNGTNPIYGITLLNGTNPVNGTSLVNGTDPLSVGDSPVGTY